MTRMISALPVVIMIQSMDTMTAENMETAFGASIPLHANDDIVVVFFLIYSGKYLIRRMWYMEILWMSQERYQQQIKVSVLSSSNTQRIIFSSKMDGSMYK